MKTRKPKINVRLLRRVQRAILKHPTQFVMWVTFYDETESGFPAGGCGTAACIAGWTLHLAKGQKTLQATRQLHDKNTLKKAACLIGVPLFITKERHQHPLFYVNQWPNKFQRRWKQTKNPRTQARITGDRIEAFIKEEAAR